MPTHQILRGFTLANPRFFEDIAHYVPDGDLEREVSTLESRQVTVSRRGPWVACMPAGQTLPPHGWKIHISVVPAQARAAMQVLLAEFTRAPFHFKILRDTALVVAATSPWWPPSQVGKIAVIYPLDAEHCRELLKRLHLLLKDFAGPRVLTDRRYEDSKCLYYRYGEFNTEHRIRPNGTAVPALSGPDGQEWLDERLPIHRMPPWVQNLLPVPRPRPVSREIHGYLVTKAVHHNGCGGLYLARKVADQTTVLLKESRPHTTIDGVSGPARLRREFAALTELRRTGVGPEPLGLFEHHEHLFLAREHIELGSLAEFLEERHPLARGDLSTQSLDLYRHQTQAILANLRSAVATVHDRGICHSNLTPANVLVDPTTLAVRLVGFGHSGPLPEWSRQSPAGPGFRPPPGSAAWSDPVSFDEFGVTSIELALVTPHNALRDLNPHALVRSARHAAAALEHPLGDLLERLELPEDNDTEPRDLAVVVEETVRFVESTLTADRADRPFPASPDMYATNPWSVAHGAAGVVRGLHRITGDVHPALRTWMDANTAGLDKLPPGLYTGLAGVGWTLLDTGETQRGLELVDRANRAAPGSLPAGILDGAAGLGLANLAAWHQTGRTEFLEAATRLGDHLIHAAADTGLGLHWPETDTKTNSFGYAHGSSGVAAFLLYLHLATGEQRFLRTARRALDQDLSQLAPGSSGLPQPYWERGAAGFGEVLARFCHVTGDERLRAALDRLVPDAMRGLLREPGLFNGMAGVVNLALSCRELLGGRNYERLAEDLVDSITALACRQPEGLAFPGRGLLRYSNDFASGSIGVALVLDRLRHGGPDFNYTLDELLSARLIGR